VFLNFASAIAPPSSLSSGLASSDEVPQQQFSRLSKVPQRLAYAISARAPVAEEKYETDKDGEGHD